MTLPKKIMVYSRDPGAANCVMPVFKLLSKISEYQVDLIGKDFALTKYADNLLVGEDLNVVIPEISPAAIKTFLQKRGYDLIFSGVGSDDLTDRLIWQAAKELHIPAVVVLDQWLNYSRRFSFNLSDGEIDRQAMVIPDFICVMDDLAKEEMIKEGFNPKILKITGQPYFESVVARQELITTQGREDILKNLGLQSGAYKIIFVSEPIVESYSKDSYLGYNQISILEELLKALSLKLKEGSNLKFDLIVKLHPRNNADVFKYTLSKHQNIQGLNIVLDKNLSPDQALSIADLLIGMSSAMLLEAAILSKPFLSLQIGLKTEDPFVLNRIGKNKAILSQTELILSLNNAIKGMINNHEDVYLVKGSVEKIKQVIDEVIWKN